jgi:hypothetical protein
MDKEYLQHIAGSLYTKGLEEQIGARVRSGMKNIGAMTGSPMESREYTYIRYSFEKFLKGITPVLDDFAENVDRLRRFKPSLTPNQNKVVDSIVDLHNVIKPRYYGVTVNPPGRVQDYPPGRYPYIKGIQKPLTPLKGKQPTKIAEIIDEGMLGRSVIINKAWTSRNAGKIIAAYIKNIYDKQVAFYAEVKKLTGRTPNRIQTVLRDINRKWSNIFGKVSATISTWQTQAEPTGKTFVSPIGAKPEGKPISPDLTLPPETPPETSTTPPAVAAVLTPDNGKPAATVPAVGDEIPPPARGDDFAYIVENVVKIIIDTVRTDTERSKDYFEAERLPRTWEEPSIHAKEREKKIPTTIKTPSGITIPSTVPITTTASIIPDTIKEQEDEPESKPEKPTGKFLYDFRSAYRKSRNFAIEMGDQKSITLSSGKTKNIRVIWVNKDQKNEIHVKYQDAAEAVGDQKHVWKEIILLNFYDYEADSRSEEWQKDEGNRLFTYIHNANPYDNPLEGASKERLARLQNKSLMDKFNRALYVVIDRKAMEFSAMGLNIGILDDELATIFRYDRSGKKPPINVEELLKYIRSPNVETRTMWIEKLKDLGWFARKGYPIPDPKQDPSTYEGLPIPGEEEPITTPAPGTTAIPTGTLPIPDIDKIPAAMEARSTLLNKGWKGVFNAIGQAAKNLGDRAKTASPDEYVKLATDILKASKAERDPKYVLGIENTNNAVMALEKLGFNKVVAIKAVAEIANTEGENLTDSEYTEKALKLLKPDKKTLPSTSVGGPPPTSPVSGEPSKSAGGEPSKSPVSKPASKKAKKGKLKEGFINPFQETNFL